MTITIKKIALPEQHSESGDVIRMAENTLGIVGGVEIECLVRIGTLTLTVSELRQLKQGQVFTLDQKTNEPVDILINQKVIARGELMCSEDYFAIQVTELPS